MESNFYEWLRTEQATQLPSSIQGKPGGNDCPHMARSDKNFFKKNSSVDENHINMQKTSNVMCTSYV